MDYDYLAKLLFVGDSAYMHKHLASKGIKSKAQYKQIADKIDVQTNVCIEG